MAQPLQLGLEIAGPDWAALLPEGLGTLPEELDETGAAYVVIGADRGHGALASASPTIVGTVLARRTRRVGVVVASSPQRDHPYNAARRVASLDHISAGRAGLLALRGDEALALGVVDGSVWAPVSVGAEELADAVHATRKLWRTWPSSTLVEGPGAYADPIRYADHVGVFSTKGPLNVPTTPQGEPVVLWPLPGHDLLADAAVGVTVADVLIADGRDLDAVGERGRERLVDTLGRACLHVRLEVPLDTIAEQVERLAATPYVHGVSLAVAAADLGALAREILPPLIASGLLAPAARGTLRERLGVPRRTDPDLSGNAAAFPPPATKESA